MWLIFGNPQSAAVSASADSGIQEHINLHVEKNPELYIP